MMTGEEVPRVKASRIIITLTSMFEAWPGWSRALESLEVTRHADF
jgi:hypothetical protein